MSNLEKKMDRTLKEVVDYVENADEEQLKELAEDIISYDKKTKEEKADHFKTSKVVAKITKDNLGTIEVGP